MLEHIFSRVEKKPNGCWEWQGNRSSSGYGRYGQKYVHRIVYEELHGELPVDVFVRHKCDNRPCCNPEHLVDGSHEDNMHDMAVRGRQFGNHRLTGKQVSAIRQDKRKAEIVANEYGIAIRTVYSIRSGERWPENQQ